MNSFENFSEILKEQPQATIWICEYIQEHPETPTIIIEMIGRLLYNEEEIILKNNKEHIFKCMNILTEHLNEINETYNKNEISFIIEYYLG